MAMNFLMNLFPSSYGVMKKDVISEHGSAVRIVMVVDDDDDFRFLVRDRLERMGMKCFEAENGEVAQLLLKRNDVGLVITDNHMPKMDGLELIDWLQQSQRHVPIIFVSGDLSITTREKAEQARVYAILEKPCSLSELSLKVEEVFREF